MSNNRVKHKYRLRFRKDGKMVFVGHLDFLKLFQRAVKRARLPVSYSMGFNPHQLMSFGLPLPLGMVGLNEFVDIELDEIIHSAIVTERLNQTLPDGIYILETVHMPLGSKTAAAVIKYAEYEIVFPSFPQLDSYLDTFITELTENSEIIVEKRTKKGFVSANIREDIISLTNSSAEGNTALTAVLSAGSVRNIKPELVAEYICKTAGVECGKTEIKYVRSKLILNDLR